MPAKKILATLQLYGTVPVAADITQGDLYSPGNTTVRTEQLPEVLDMPKLTSSGHTHMCTCVCSLEYVSSCLLCMFPLILRWRRSTCCGSAGQLASQVIGWVFQNLMRHIFVHVLVSGPTQLETARVLAD